MGVGTKHPLLQQKVTITSKMHLLETHVPEFARKWRATGFFSEDVVESLHKDCNEEQRTLCSLRNAQDKMSVGADMRNLRFEQAARSSVIDTGFVLIDP